MDRTLADRLNDLWLQSDALKKADEKYLSLEGQKKSLLAQLTLRSEGKSFSEREAKALASEDWIHFIAAHVEAESEFNFEKRKFEILEKAYLAEHATFKIEDRSIRKQGA